MPDRFQNFDDLRRNMSEADYRIRIVHRNSNVAIIAPHGGKIEPGTSLVAAAIAGEIFNLYCFEGNRVRGNRDLHVTSHRFDEPRCLALVETVDVVVAIHGERGRDDPDTTLLGGLDFALRERIGEALSACGFEARFNPGKLPGLQARNICNRGRSSRGVQLEIPRSLRDQLAKNAERLEQFSHAVRVALGAG